ncbi:exported hypothetical protein [Agrobacterium genomosp. 13 str. CFBP 6927]|uniref:Secreted protein n=1 Tax=Agrobacterium genomosp. 13 str. CFBP 6927 TaxID=1183428 RepID=A0ABM9VJB5_9HYPH|nr:exported hypothetical protein [Agrobacterium genomosp. 13 str. CFBP 6927]
MTMRGPTLLIALTGSSVAGSPLTPIRSSRRSWANANFMLVVDASAATLAPMMNFLRLVESI